MQKRPWYRFASRKLSDPAAPPVETRIIKVQKDAQGVSGTEKYAGIFTEDYFRTLQGYLKAKEYDKMRRGDARVKMVLSAVKNPIRSATWKWKPGDTDEQSKKHAEFLDFIFMKDIGINKKKKFKTLLTEALTICDFGMAVFERVHKVGMSHPQFGDYIGLKSLGWRNPKTLFYFHTDESGELVDIEQWAQGDIKKTVKMDAAFLTVMTMEQEGDNYEGISLLRPVYGAWSRKQTYLKLNVIGMERNAIPMPKVEVPSGKESSPEFNNMIETLEDLTSHESNYITYPAGWKVDFHDGKFDPEKCIKSVQFENEEMTYAFLANFLSLGAGGNGGAFALSSDLSDFFTNGILFIADLIAEELNEIGKELIDLNFGAQEKYPVLGYQGIDDKIGLEFGNMMKALSDSKNITPDDNVEDELRRRLKLPAMREEDKGKRDKVAAIVPPVDPNNPNPDPNNPNDPNADPNIDPNADPNNLNPDNKDKKPEKLSAWETRIQLAESKAKSVIGDSQDRVRTLMSEQLASIGKDLVGQVMKSYRSLPDSQKHDAINGISATGSREYYQELKQLLANIAGESIAGARKEVPKAKNATLADDTKFESLPAALQKRLLTQSRLLVSTTMNDLEKVVFLQFGDSVESTDSADIIEADIGGAVETFTEGSSVVAAGGNAASRIVNEARSAFFFDDAVLSEIESFTFVNGDPVSDICQSLAGKTFRKDDPEADRYFPPLHHNCKSYIVPNLVGADDNPPLSPGGLKTRFTPTL